MINIEKNSSILSCPRCGKPLVNIASKVVRVHPVARFIEEHHFHLVIICGFIMTGILLLGYQLGFLGYFRGALFAWLALITAPSMIMYFVVRCFSFYRVTECPYCDFREQQKLGRSVGS